MSRSTGLFPGSQRGAKVCHGDRSKAERGREVGSRQESDLNTGLRSNEYNYLSIQDHARRVPKPRKETQSL